MGIYHPCSEEIPTPRPCGSSLHEDVVTDAHIWSDVELLHVVSTNQQEEIVDRREDENKQDDKKNCVFFPQVSFGELLGDTHEVLYCNSCMYA